MKEVTGNFDTQTVILICTLLVGIITILAQAWYTFFTNRNNWLLQFIQKWDSEEFQRARVGASQYLLECHAQGKPVGESYDLIRILNFIQELSSFTSWWGMSTEMVWFHFYGPLRRYWYAAKDFEVVRAQQEKKSNYAAAAKLMRQMERVDSRKNGRESHSFKPDYFHREIHQFGNHHEKQMHGAFSGFADASMGRKA